MEELEAKEERLPWLLSHKPEHCNTLQHTQMGQIKRVMSQVCDICHVQVCERGAMEPLPWREFHGSSLTHLNMTDVTHL